MTLNYKNFIKYFPKEIFFFQSQENDQSQEM